MPLKKLTGFPTRAVYLDSGTRIPGDLRDTGAIALTTYPYLIEVCVLETLTSFLISFTRISGSYGEGYRTGHT